ncbi:MAG: hypothetical protein NT023_03300 [Armatimonadetes bacterium]|nr:hypothetical protein [Armatimonadota bacterium]
MAEGLVDAEAPLLQVGQRYLLFLRRLITTGRDSKRGYLISEDNGIVGKSAELDEYMQVHHIAGKVWITSDGMTALSANQTEWQYRTGPQILGIPEDAAVSLIQDALKQ